MKIGMVNKSTTVNRFVLHTLQRNITHLAVITRKTNIKLGILKGGDWKRAEFLATHKKLHILEIRTASFECTLTAPNYSVGIFKFRKNFLFKFLNSSFEKP